MKKSLPPARGLQLFLQCKAADGRPNQLLLAQFRVQGIFASLKQNALAGVIVTEDCLKLTPELDRDASLVASSPNVVVADVTQESVNLVAVPANGGHEHVVEDTLYLLGRDKRHRREQVAKLGLEHPVLFARFIGISIPGPTDGDLDVTEDLNEGSGS